MAAVVNKVELRKKQCRWRRRMRQSYTDCRASRRGRSSARRMTLLTHDPPEPVVLVGHLLKQAHNGEGKGMGEAPEIGGTREDGRKVARKTRVRSWSRATRQR